MGSTRQRGEMGWVRLKKVLPRRVGGERGRGKGRSDFILISKLFEDQRIEGGTSSTL